VTEITTGLRGLRRIIGAVHEVVEIGQAGGGQLGKRDRGLAVVQRGRGQQSADRDIAIGDIEMQLLNNPAFRVALGIALGSNRVVRRQIVQHLGERHGGLRSSRCGSFSTTSPFLGRPRWRFGCGGTASITGFSRASMAVASREIWPTSRS
jgi:hypothetical protein